MGFTFLERKGSCNDLMYFLNSSNLSLICNKLCEAFLNSKGISEA